MVSFITLVINTRLCAHILFIKKILFSISNMHHKAVNIMLQKRHTVSEDDRGWNSSVGSMWARCLALTHFGASGKGDFSLEVNMGSHSIPLKTLLDESLSTHAFHCTDSKDPDIHVLHR